MLTPPEWVPDSVLTTYERLANRQHMDGLPLFDEQTIDEFFESSEFEVGLGVLRSAIESRDMRKAWAAIEKRSHLYPPENIALLILGVPLLLREIELASDGSHFPALKTLAQDLVQAQNKFESRSGVKIKKRLRQEIAYYQRIVGYLEDIWEEYMRDLVGQRFAPNAKRTFIVRRLAEVFQEVYEQPLYDTVALLAANLLNEEPLEPDHVRKLVTSRPAKHKKTNLQPGRKT